jgi:hypothetical protein
MVCHGGPVEAPAQHFDDPGYLDFEEAVLHLDRYLLVMDDSECYEFNDAQGRTLHDVTSVLRQAAATPAHELLDALRVIRADDERRTHLFGDAGQVRTAVSMSTTAYPGHPVRLPACEAACSCTDGFQCVHCALQAEQTGDGDRTGGDGQ